MSSAWRKNEFFLQGLTCSSTRRLPPQYNYIIIVHSCKKHNTLALTFNVVTGLLHPRDAPSRHTTHHHRRAGTQRHWAYTQRRRAHTQRLRHTRNDTGPTCNAVGHTHNAAGYTRNETGSTPNAPGNTCNTAGHTRTPPGTHATPLGTHATLQGRHATHTTPQTHPNAGKTRSAPR